MMPGPEVYVKLDIIDLVEVGKILPRIGPQMYIMGTNNEPPQAIEGAPQITLFDDIEAFRQTKWFKGIVIGYQKGTESYNPTDKCLVQLEETNQLVHVQCNQVFENISFEPPEDGDANDSEEAIIND